mmetsp:Transcript_24541/g.30179  ORF Transcript_24541/g.30179 Transcript_24541/m.30179 type:complete len:722 (-) Transcript_24541:142-2307(-)
MTSPSPSPNVNPSSLETELHAATANSSCNSNVNSTYNLKPISSPRLTGLLLRLFAKLLRIPFLGRWILNVLKKKNNLNCVQEFACTLPSHYVPLFYPIHAHAHYHDHYHNHYHDMKQSESPTSISDVIEYQHKILKESDTVDSDAIHCRWRHWSVSDYLREFKNQSITPLQIVNSLITIIQSHSQSQSDKQDKQKNNPYILPLTKTQIQQLRQYATESTQRYASKSPMKGQLDGIPITVKDDLDVKGYTTTKGTSFINKTQPATNDCTSVARLRLQGVIIIGKNNQHEIGCGTTGYNMTYGTPRNPYSHHLNHYTGGSSSGPAGAVASGLVPFAIGTDGGGSVRIPAALCGVIGIKPTYNRIPDEFKSAISIAHTGILAGSISDAAIAYHITAGSREREYTNDKEDEHEHPKNNELKFRPLRVSASQPPVDMSMYMNTSKTSESDDASLLKNIKIGIYRPHIQDAQTSIISATNKAIQFYKSKGAQIIDIELPHLQQIHLAHSITILSEMRSAMSTYYTTGRSTSPGRKQGQSQNLVQTQSSPEIQISLELAKTLSAQDYLAAQRIRNYAMTCIETLFRTQIDILLSPATAQVAPLIGRDVLESGESNLKQTAALMKFIIHGNFTGIPGIVFPIAYYGDDNGEISSSSSSSKDSKEDDDAKGLPISLQLQAAHWNEDLLFHVANIGEQGLLSKGWKKPKGCYVDLFEQARASSSLEVVVDK